MTKHLYTSVMEVGRREGHGVGIDGCSVNDGRGVGYGTGFCVGAVGVGVGLDVGPKQ